MKADCDNSYQGYEVQKHRALMTGKMYFQLSISCLVAQLLLMLLLIQLMVPLLHRELAHFWPIARLETTGEGEPNYPSARHQGQDEKMAPRRGR
jgi:hypothetical protein